MTTLAQLCRSASHKSAPWLSKSFHLFGREFITKLSFEEGMGRRQS